MGDYWQGLLIILTLIAANAFFAAGEIAVISARHVKVKQLADEGNAAAKALHRLMKDQSRFLATIQVGITLAGFLASASAAVGISAYVQANLVKTGLAAGTARSISVLLVTLAVAYITLVFGELTPKRLALQSPERIALFVARPIEMLARIAGPFTRLLTHTTNLTVRLMGGNTEQNEHTISEEELRLYVEEHEELEEDEKRIIAGVFDFGDCRVGELVVPRTEMECLDIDTSVSVALGEVRNSNFSYFPVYEGNYDNIAGIVSLRDLLYRVLDQKSGSIPEETLAGIMTPPRFVPESKRALDLLKEMQQTNCPMSIVIDEYGGVAGLVTIRDLVREIVGDAGEDEEAGWHMGADREYIIAGTESVEDINERLGSEIPESSHYQTLGGFILFTLGHIPQSGSVVEIPGWSFTIKAMDGMRIAEVKAAPSKN